MPPPRPPPPPVLLDELVEEVLLLLPPEEPAWLVRSSVVCKPWRRILASLRFRRRYRKFHRTPPLLGFFGNESTFIPTSALLLAQPGRPGWISLDCRHGRVLFAPSNPYGDPFDLIVLDPMAGHQRRQLSPCKVNCSIYFSAAVLCPVQGCDHHDCQRGHFRVAFVSTDVQEEFTSAWLYSSETGAWSELTTMGYPNGITNCKIGAASVILGDALYFSIDGIIKYELSTLSLSTFEKPTTCDGSLMMVEDGGLGFAAVAKFTNLSMWSMQTVHDGWVKLRGRLEARHSFHL